MGGEVLWRTLESQGKAHSHPAQEGSYSRGKGAHRTPRLWPVWVHAGCTLGTQGLAAVPAETDKQRKAIEDTQVTSHHHTTEPTSTGVQ